MFHTSAEQDTGPRAVPFAALERAFSRLASGLIAISGYLAALSVLAQAASRRAGCVPRARGCGVPGEICAAPKSFGMTMQAICAAGKQGSSL